MKKGKVFIIGSGPGDPELITIKGFNALKKCDVVLYDFLSANNLLKFTKNNCQKICVGKADGLHLLEQGQINKLLLEKARAGKIVARLKGGDPFVFSRGIEEARFLSKRGIDFEIVPGLTSGIAAPGSFGIPLTVKGKHSSVAILTGHKSNGHPLDAPACDTLIYVMAVGNINNVVKRILKSGKPKTTKCAFIERGTCHNERVIEGNLGTIEKKAKVNRIKPPAVFIVGEVVKYGQEIFKKKYR